MLTSAWQNRDSWVVVNGAHWLSLTGAFGFLVWVDRHQWFDTDQWDFLVDRSVLGHHGTAGLLQPHVDHWSTIPILGFRALFSVFGVRTYLPYITVTILVSLAIAHLLWRLLLRVGVSPWFAVVACGLFAVLGVAWQDLTSAFQWQLIGPLLTGFAALLVSSVHGPIGRRDALVVLLLLVGLLCSGVGLVMVIVIVIAIALRRGIRSGVAIAIVPAVVYGTWYLAYGRHAQALGSLPLRTALQRAPNFVWQGFLAAVDGATGLPAIGAVLLVLLGLWLLRNALPSREPWPLVLSPAIGAVLFLFLTALKRGGLGIMHAQDSRYTYVAIALLLPPAALALDRLLNRRALRTAVLVVGGLALLVVQLSTLNNQANIAAQLAQERKHRILGAAILAREHVKVISQVVVPVFDPQLTLSAIDELSRNGQLPGNVTVTPADVLTAREYLQASLGRTARVAQPVAATVLTVTGAQLVTGSEPDCKTVAPQSDRPTIVLSLHSPTVLALSSGYGGPMTLALRAGDASGRPADLRLPAEQTEYLSLDAVPADLVLGLPPVGPTTLCGLAPLNT
jgi:hypothetical protein